MKLLYIGVTQIVITIPLGNVERTPSNPFELPPHRRASKEMVPNVLQHGIGAIRAALKQAGPTHTTGATGQWTWTRAAVPKTRTTIEPDLTEMAQVKIAKTAYMAGSVANTIATLDIASDRAYMARSR